MLVADLRIFTIRLAPPFYSLKSAYPEPTWAHAGLDQPVRRKTAVAIQPRLIHTTDGKLRKWCTINRIFRLKYESDRADPDHDLRERLPHGRSAIRSMRRWIKSPSVSLALTIALFLRTACSESKQLD